VTNPGMHRNRARRIFGRCFSSATLAIELDDWRGGVAVLPGDVVVLVQNRKLGHRWALVGGGAGHGVAAFMQSEPIAVGFRPRRDEAGTSSL